MTEAKELYFQFIGTSQGKIGYIDSGGSGFPIVFIHGKTCSSKVFQKQLNFFSQKFRVIAIDLPGHGKSDRPKNPDDAYTIPGYAKLLDEVLGKLSLNEFIVVGYSLGGNIALQWTQLSDSIKGVMMVCSAPMRYSKEAFLAYPPHEDLKALKDTLSESEAHHYMKVSGFNVDDPALYFMVEDALLTDCRSGRKMVESVLAGKGVDETVIVSQLPLPLAIVLGENDLIASKDYTLHLNYRNLWKNKIELIKNGEHALVFHQSDQFNTLLENFVKDVLA